MFNVDKVLEENFKGASLLHVKEFIKYLMNKGCHVQLRGEDMDKEFFYSNNVRLACIKKLKELSIIEVNDGYIFFGKTRNKAKSYKYIFQTPTTILKEDTPTTILKEVKGFRYKGFGDPVDFSITIQDRNDFNDAWVSFGVEAPLHIEVQELLVSRGMDLNKVSWLLDKKSIKHATS